MSATRWLSALLLVALVLSAVPAAVSAAPAAVPVLQEPAAAGSTSYLLVVTPPKVSIPASTSALQVAGHFNIEHARYYSMIQARLEAWQRQGVIAGFTREPAAYAFVVRGVTPAVLTDLAALGQVQPAGDLSAAAVDNFSSAYQASLQAAIAAAAHAQLASAPPAPSNAHTPSGAHSAAMSKAGFASSAVVAANGASPYFYIQLYSSDVQGQIATGTLVTATLKTSAGVVKGTAHGTSYLDWVYLDLEDRYGNSVVVAPTDILELQVPALITIPVVNLSASINSSARTATGFAPPNVTAIDNSTRPWLYFGLAQTSYITTTPSGIFAVNTVDASPGRTWELRFANSESQETFVSGEIPVLVLRGYYQNYLGYYDNDDAYVSGAVIDANAVLTATLTRAGSPPIVSYTRSDEDGTFGLHLRDPYFNDVAILPGDTVQVTGGGVTLSATVPTFDVTSDPTTDTVSGMTNATVVTDTIHLTQTLAIFPESFDERYIYGYGKMALAPGGSFSVGNDFYQGADPTAARLTLDWPPGMLGHLRYVNADGNVIFAGFRANSAAPILSLRGDGGYMADNLVAGQAQVNERGVVSLLDANNVVKARTIVYANPLLSVDLLDVYGNPLPIADGDSVVATYAGQTMTVKAPLFTITADPETDVVVGRITGALVTTIAPGAPQSLAVFPAVGSTDNPQYVQPDANGDFRADFTGIVNLIPGGEGYVKYVDANLNTVYAKWQVPLDKPVLSLRGDYDYEDEDSVSISLPNYVPQSPCTKTIFVSVKAQDNSVRWQRTMAACEPILTLHLDDGLGNPISLNPADTVQATFEGKTATAVVPSFSVISDPKTSTVSGTTNATVTASGAGLTQTLAVWPADQSDFGFGKFVLVSGSTFSATNPFYNSANPASDQLDLSWGPGRQGHLRYIDADGNSIYATFAAVAEQPVLDIQKGSNWVEGVAPVSAGPVTVTVRSGSTVKGVGSTITGLGGMFDMQIYDGRGNPIRIDEGDVIEFTPPLTTAIVPPLTGIVDVDNDRISGKGPANSLLNFGLYDMTQNHEGMTVATDKDGNYVLNLRGLVDIQPNMWGWLEYRNPDGQTFYIEQHAGTSLEGGLNTSRVWGLAPAADDPVQVTVQRAGSLIGMDTRVADEDGDYTAFLIDATGRPVILQAGDVISAYFGSGSSRTLTLAPLQLSVDLAANTLRGTGPAASLLGVDVWYGPDTTVLTEGNGQWSLNLDTWLYEIAPGQVADVVYTANAVDYTWLGAVAPVFWVRSNFEYDDDAFDDYSVVNNLVTGYAASYAPVMVTLKRNGGVLAFASMEADYWGYYLAYLRDRNGLDADIMPGDVVEVQSVSGPPVSVTVPLMTAVVDYIARMITGTGPANAAMGLHMDLLGSKTVHTGPDGSFSTTLPGINPTSVGSRAVLLTYREPQGNWIRVSTGQLVVDPAHLEVRWNRDAADSFYGGYLAHTVSGSAGAPLTQVQLSLQRGGLAAATAAVMSDQDGYFIATLRDGDGEPLDILPGDLIEMVAGEVTKSLTVPELTAQANLESQTVYGTGPANAPLFFSTQSCDEEGLGAAWEGDAAINPDGSWVLPCHGLGHGAVGWIAVQDLQGNMTYLDWGVPYVSVRLNGNEVHGVLAPEVEAHVQLWRLNVVVAETVVTASEYNGELWAQFLGNGGSPFIILPNDTVVVTYGGQSITVPVVPLSATVDNAADTVTGIGPASQDLEVAAGTNGMWAERHVMTGGNGAYVANFAGALDIQGGDYIEVWHINADGNVVYLDHSAALVRINLGSDIVDGYATPNSMASVVLKRGGSVIASTKVPTGMDGAFSAFFLDTEGNLINLVAGDVVEVTASPTVAYSAVELTAVVDPTLDQITGSAPAGAAVLVTAYRCTVVGCSEYQATAIAAAAGSYRLDLAGIFDLDLTSYAYVQVVDGEGNITSFTTTPSGVPQLASVESTLQAQGARQLASTFGTANAGNLTPPLAVIAVGAGKLIFVANGGPVVVTAPDGTILRSDTGYLTVANPLSGKWLVQVLVDDGQTSGYGTQYSIAVGQGLYTIYMPIVKLLTKK
ncbi:MAG: hypothetical protein U0X20_01965 [Caldilineaceae bacterium]